MPLISVVITTYNRPDHLENAIKTVQNQTVDDLEIIVIDGMNSTENQNVVKKAKEKRVKYIGIEHDTGIQHARTLGCQKSTGKYIAMLDDDDLWTKDHLEKSLEFIRRYGYDFITSQYAIIQNNTIEKKRLLPIKDYLGLESMSHDNPLISCHSSWFYKAELKRFKYNPECYKKETNRVNDVDMLERMYKAGVKMGFCPEVLTYIQPRPNEKEVGLKAVRDKK